MKIIIEEYEDYPVYGMRRGKNAGLFEKVVEVSKEQIDNWKKVTKEYENVQLEMRNLYKGYGG